MTHTNSDFDDKGLKPVVNPQIPPLFQGGKMGGICGFQLALALLEERKYHSARINGTPNFNQVPSHCSLVNLL